MILVPPPYSFLFYSVVVHPLLILAPRSDFYSNFYISNPDPTESGVTTKSNTSHCKLYIDELEKDVLDRAYPRKTHNVHNSNAPLISKMVRHPSNNSLIKVDNYRPSPSSLRSSPGISNDIQGSPAIAERTITFDALTGIMETNSNSNIYDTDKDFLERSEHGTIRMLNTGN